MKTLFFDCSSGISGNMTLGALTEIIGDEKYLIDELKKLKLGGYKIEISKKVKNGITGTYVDVILENGHVHHHGENSNYEHNHDSGHEHNHHHGGHIHRNLNDIYKIIDNSELDEGVKDLSKRIFLRVAKAESKVHNRPLDEVHFHEVGAIDSIVDIVGTAILINQINPDRIMSGTVNDGYGFIKCAHGMITVPVPATSEIFSHSDVKFKQIEIDTELVTPTGAAIIAELAEEFTTLPVMNVNKIGWGAGTKELKIPNVLKIYLGDTETEEQSLQCMQSLSDRVVVMESNIDDCPGEILGYTMDKLLSNGAKDVFYTPIFMKKNRPAYQLTVICTEKDIDKLQDIIFTETTTIGIRYRYEYRTILERELLDVNTKYGQLAVKKVIRNEKEYCYPEYESAKKLAEENDIPLKEIYRMTDLQT